MTSKRTNASSKRVSEKCALPSAALKKSMAKSWSKVAPFWPLKNLIAVNPLAGFESLPFEAALDEAQAYFQAEDLPIGMQHMNRESIKWLQVFFDEGQSTLRMPHRRQGLLLSVQMLLPYDQHIDWKDSKKQRWFAKLPIEAEGIIPAALDFLSIPKEAHETFLTLMLTTLPGWAAHIQYRVNWMDSTDTDCPTSTITAADYLAFRLLLTCLLWPQAKTLLAWHQQLHDKADASGAFQQISAAETRFQSQLLDKLVTAQPKAGDKAIKAQWVFCIDVRSEPFRRNLEALGPHETFGFAGFFGVPMAVKEAVTGKQHASCPVLLKPAHTVVEQPVRACQPHGNRYKRLRGIKKLYQSLKYTFTTPFSLVETLGMSSGLWMCLRNLSPRLATLLQTKLRALIAPSYAVVPVIDSIPQEDQIAYAAGALKAMGLTENFAPLVVLCGHGSTTQNNAFASALDCGACGGYPGAANARVLAAILNTSHVRFNLEKQGIVIPEETYFLAAQHNTTTDHVSLFDETLPAKMNKRVDKLKADLKKAQELNSAWRIAEMGVAAKPKHAKRQTALRSDDWAQVRPEWGLARNAAFIVGPRWMTQQADLQGRVFLHSYDWTKDSDGSSLTVILTAPMIVGQWINAQYLFSTLDNVAYGGGSKITMNITGKVGVMQGNASDLMHGLSLESVFKTDSEPYHEPMRLTVVVNAPAARIDAIIKQHKLLQTLFGNGWVHLICHDPKSKRYLRLQRDLSWEKQAA